MNEQITSSIFITGGEELKVKTSIQGPIAQKQISSSAEVLAAAMRLDKVGKKSNLKLDFSYEIDFQNLFNDDAILQDDDFDDDYEAHMDDEMDDIVYQDYYYMDDDDEYEFMIDDAMDDMEIQEVKKAKEARDALSPQEKADRDRKKQDAKKKRMETIKREMEAKRKKKEQDSKNKRKNKLEQKKAEMKGMNEGKPVERTYRINEEGWYRFCVDASYSDVSIYTLRWEYIYIYILELIIILTNFISSHLTLGGSRNGTQIFFRTWSTQFQNWTCTNIRTSRYAHE